MRNERANANDVGRITKVSGIVLIVMSENICINVNSIKNLETKCDDYRHIALKFLRVKVKRLIEKTYHLSR